VKSIHAWKGISMKRFLMIVVLLLSIGAHADSKKEEMEKALPDKVVTSRATIIGMMVTIDDQAKQISDLNDRLGNLIDERDHWYKKWLELRNKYCDKDCI
jgi:hypothetical protein